MNTPCQLNAGFLVGCGLMLLSGTLAHATNGDDGITAVASKTSSDYKRTRLPDGSFQPEYYSFGKGGIWGGELKDSTIDKLAFSNVAHVIAVPLATQKFFPATNPATTRLLIMVYWGTTSVPGPSSDSIAYSQFNDAQNNLSDVMSAIAHAPTNDRGDASMLQARLNAADSQMSAASVMLNVENHKNDQNDFTNALMLGYDSEGLIGTEYGNNVRGTVLGLRRDELVAEIEENRYFVVLMAYDFQLLWKEKKHRLLWETRFSIREKDHQFDRDLPSMAQYASQYFGQDSHGLVRKAVPLGHVEIGNLKSLGEAPEMQTAPSPTK